jgi:hypothetical protein
VKRDAEDLPRSNAELKYEEALHPLPPCPCTDVVRSGTLLLQKEKRDIRNNEKLDRTENILNTGYSYSSMETT